MNTVARSVSRRGGLAATHEIYADGHSRHDLAAAVRTRAVVRVRQGWFVGPAVHPDLRAAARVGGSLSCLSALDLHGFWSYPTRQLHVAVAENSCRLRTRHDMRQRLEGDADVRIHWTRDLDLPRLILPAIACLADAVRCQPPDVATAVADSVLHQRPDLRSAWRDLIGIFPMTAQGWLGRVDGVCESGTESLLWFRLHPFGLPVRRQVQLTGIGRVDFLFGERLIVEADSVTYHADPVQFEADRRRDAVASRLGYRVLRFSYHQVIDRWAEVEAAILGSVIRGDHH